MSLKTWVLLWFALCLSQPLFANYNQTHYSICVLHAGDPAASIAAAQKAGFQLQELDADHATGSRHNGKEKFEIEISSPDDYVCEITSGPSDNHDPNIRHPIVIKTYIHKKDQPTIRTMYLD